MIKTHVRELGNQEEVCNDITDESALEKPYPEVKMIENLFGRNLCSKSFLDMDPKYWAIGSQDKFNANVNWRH